MLAIEARKCLLMKQSLIFLVEFVCSKVVAILCQNFIFEKLIRRFVFGKIEIEDGFVVVNLASKLKPCLKARNDFPNVKGNNHVTITYTTRQWIFSYVQLKCRWPFSKEPRSGLLVAGGIGIKMTRVI